MPQPRCKSCRYFEEYEDDGVRRFPEMGEGYCHRYPATVSKNKKDWCGEHKRPAQQQKKKEHPGAKEVIAYYCDQFKSQFGFNPTITGKDSGAAIAMLQNHTIADVNQKINEFFSNTPEYFKNNSMYSLAHVKMALNELGIRETKKTTQLAKEYNHEDLVQEQALMYGNVERFPEYKAFVYDTREMLTFEEYLKEYGSE